MMTRCSDCSGPRAATLMLLEAASALRGEPELLRNTLLVAADNLPDEEAAELGNRAGRIPHERRRER